MSNEQTTEDAISAHVAMIAIYIRELHVSPEREKQIARNVGSALLFALKEQQEALNV